MSMMNLDDFTILADGLDHPEGVAWGPDGNVYAGGEAGQIYRITMDGEITEIASTGGFILGLALDSDRNIYACDSGAGAIMKITQAGEVSKYSDNADPIPAPNYPVFVADGNLYFSSSGEWKGNSGKIYCAAPGGATRVVSEKFTNFPNGMALGPDGKYLYIVLSLKPGVERALILEDGSLGDPEDVVTIERTVPDGVAFDADGNLYASCYSPSQIYRVTPNGQVDLLAEDWQNVVLAAATNIAFSGPYLKTLVVGSLGRWHLAQAQMDVAGHPLKYPKVS